MKHKEETDSTTNGTVYNRLKRFLLRCGFCRPNKGENVKTRRKHGVRKPKHKSKRKSR